MYQKPNVKMDFLYRYFNCQRKWRITTPQKRNQVHTYITWRHTPIPSTYVTDGDSGDKTSQATR